MRGLSSLWRRDDSRPATTEQARRIDKAAIGAPVLRSIPRRFEIYAAEGFTRDSPSSQRSDTNILPPGVFPPPPRQPPPMGYPLIRSYSLPTPVCPPLSIPSDSTGSWAPPAGRANSFSPLHTGIRRPLSPILEQSCASPVSVSLKPLSPLAESEISTLNLSRPVAPFVQRTPSRATTDGTVPPSIPELNLAPPFPGPHPSQDGDGPPRRPPRVLTLPGRSSVYESAAAGSSTGSLHAESFVTALDSPHVPAADSPHVPAADSPHVPAADAPRDSVSLEDTHTHRSAASSTLPVPSHEEHLERHGTCASGASLTLSLRRKPQRLAFATPAFCAFWLGFLFPPLWWVGGWYFTRFTETPAQRTLWEHYVLATRWGAALCLCGRRPARAKVNGKPLLLPRWVEARNTAASLQGISYYYPFVSRPAGYVSTGAPLRLHRLFDRLTRSQLAEVKRAREGPRRMIDPWIERCRRALCYWCLALLLCVLGMMGWSFAVGAGKTRY